MKLICNKCRISIYESEPDDPEDGDDDGKRYNVGSPCTKISCTGRFALTRVFHRMVGDPDITYTKDPEKVIYDFMLAQKNPVVPVSLRRGLWFHVW